MPYTTIFGFANLVNEIYTCDMPKTAATDDPAMVTVRRIWEGRQVDGWTMQTLGEKMGYPSKTARQSVSQFLKSRTPQVAMLRKFARAVGVSFEAIGPGRGAAMSSEKAPAQSSTVKDESALKRELPFNPINAAMNTPEHARRTIVGVLESYNGNYDALAEAVQNAMDALEDAHLQGLPGQFSLEIRIDLNANAISVFDTGVGMTQSQICEACAPSATFKDADYAQVIVKKRGEKNTYRGYKGVGLTFLAYGTDDIQIQSRQNGGLIKGRMRNGRQWAEGKVDDAPLLETDSTSTPLDKTKRGTWVKFGFSPSTRPANLFHLGTSLETWEAIVRTRTAAGQVLIDREPVVPIKVTLKVISKDGVEQSAQIQPEFYLPHLVERNPPYRFLDVGEYYAKHPGIADHAAESKRQDAVYLRWDADEIRKQLGERAAEFANELEAFTPALYAFRPYHAPVWSELNKNATNQIRAHFFAPGLVIAVNRQRMADVLSIKASRSELLAQNVFVLVHFDKAKPDQGRKTLQSQVMELAQYAADAATQYLLKQSALLKPAGEKTTAAQREVEKNHEDWVYNVKEHAKVNPLSIPPVSYASVPLAEQDVVGLFNQFAALGVFPGIKILATSAAHTYDCYALFDCRGDLEALRYRAEDNQLGLSTDVLGLDETQFVTRGLTVEFKNNLEGLIHDINNPLKPKTFSRIDICVCWGSIEQQHGSYQLTEITEANLHERGYPGITHLLRKDGESHVIQVIMLEEIAKQVSAGNIRLKT